MNFDGTFINCLRTFIYIPVWCDLNFRQSRLTFAQIRHLHSSMVRFELVSLVTPFLSILNLHSSMVRFELRHKDIVPTACPDLHSSMVRFEFFIASDFEFKYAKFTFQYGAI